MLFLQDSDFSYAESDNNMEGYLGKPGGYVMQGEKVHWEVKEVAVVVAQNS